MPNTYAARLTEFHPNELLVLTSFCSSDPRFGAIAGSTGAIVIDRAIDRVAQTLFGAFVRTLGPGQIDLRGHFG